jgi:tetratricopeptide (TPR) repeat protein
MFDGDALQVLSKAREVQFQPSHDVAPALPPKVHEILERALAKDPAQRYQSCADMLSDVEECLYENDLRPTARSVAQYMKALFDQDIVKEERFMRETMQIDLHGRAESRQESEPRKRRVLEKTLRISLPDIKEKVNKRRSRYAALAAALAVAVGLFFIFSYDSRPVSALQKMLSLLPGTSNPSEDFDRGAPDAPLPDERPQPQNPEAALASLPEPLVPEERAPTSLQPTPAQLEPAMTALDNGEFEKAVSLFEESLSLEPGLRETISDAYGQALVGQAVRTAENAPQEAETLLAKALALNPENSRAHFELASLYAKQGDYTKAAASYQKVTELDPQFSEPLFNLAYIYYVQGDLSRAEETYHRVAALAPPYLDEVYFNLAVVQEEQGKTAQCIRSLERTLALNPDSPEARNYLLRLKGESKKP